MVFRHVSGPTIVCHESRTSVAWKKIWTKVGLLTSIVRRVQIAIENGVRKISFLARLFRENKKTPAWIPCVRKLYFVICLSVCQSLYPKLPVFIYSTHLVDVIVANDAVEQGIKVVQQIHDLHTWKMKSIIMRKSITTSQSQRLRFHEFFETVLKISFSYFSSFQSCRVPGWVYFVMTGTWSQRCHWKKLTPRRNSRELLPCRWSDLVQPFCKNKYFVNLLFAF